MPRRKTSLRRRTVMADITPAKVEYMFRGCVMFASDPADRTPFASDAEVRAFWDTNREKLMRWFTLTGVPMECRRCAFEDPEDCDPQPGHRPWAWWKIDAPEKRRRILTVTHQIPRAGGFASFVERLATPQDAELIWAGSGGEAIFGAPRYGWVPGVESEPAYLERHGLIDAEERTALETWQEVWTREHLVEELLTTRGYRTDLAATEWTRLSGELDKLGRPELLRPRAKYNLKIAHEREKGRNS